jgi:hypothetical protein
MPELTRRWPSGERLETSNESHVFKGRGNWYAFAASNDGSVLPPENGPWVPWKILDMNRGEAPRVGISTDEVLDAIQDGNAYLVEMKTEVVKETFRRT